MNGEQLLNELRAAAEGLVRGKWPDAGEAALRRKGLTLSDWDAVQLVGMLAHVCQCMHLAANREEEFTT